MGKIPAGLRVLVVEDEFMIAMAVEAVVTDAGGIVVDMAATLEQAVALAATAEFDAALLDINLNGQNSFPVADILGKRGIPFAFVTGYGRKMVPDAFAAAPILTKPYARNELMRVLGSLSENHVR
ncbi:MAG: response regulator [Rhodospirillales bacterium]|nr:response regulator [Rhodospirillales bacterium]